MWSNPQQTAELVTFTEEILNGKLIFCAVSNLAKFTASLLKKTTL